MITKLRFIAGPSGSLYCPKSNGLFSSVPKIGVDYGPPAHKRDYRVCGLIRRREAAETECVERLPESSAVVGDQQQAAVAIFEAGAKRNALEV